VPPTEVARSTPRARITPWVLSWLALLGACAAAPASPLGPADHIASSDEPVEFSFPGAGDTQVNSATTRGRATLLVFVTTYDLASQLVLRRVADVIARQTPRANAAAVVLEPPVYADLLPAYRQSLSLPYPVVIADFATQQGQGQFGGIQRVPTLVVLDREGREVSRSQGSLTLQEIEAALSRANRRSN
jgi:hypothetical protein